MSEATLTKILKDCSKMEAELEVYRKSQPLASSCELIISYINQNNESFNAGRADPNPWHASSGGGGCTIA